MSSLELYEVKIVHVVHVVWRPWDRDHQYHSSVFNQTQDPNSSMRGSLLSIRPLPVR